MILAISSERRQLSNVNVAGLHLQMQQAYVVGQHQLRKFNACSNFFTATESFAYQVAFGLDNFNLDKLARYRAYGNCRLVVFDWDMSLGSSRLGRYSAFGKHPRVSLRLGIVL